MSIALFRKPPLATRLARAVKALFAYGEQGAWYDPSDLSTLYQDSAGTTPVTAVGQPVGLMLDKRLGLVRGAELIPDSSFDDTTKWTKTQPTSGSVTVSGGVLTINSTDGSYANASPVGVNVVANAWYEYVITLTSCTGNLTVNIGGTQGVNFTGAGVFRGVLFTSTTAMEGVKRAGGAVNGVVTDFSVRKLDGNHATQATAANRPILQQDGGGRYYLAFNGTNSSMSMAAINFTGTDKMTVWAGISVFEPAAQVLVLEHGASFANAGSFSVTRNVGFYGIYGRSTAGSTAFAGKTRTFGTGGAVIAGQIDYAASAGSEFSLVVSRQAANGAIGATEENTGTLGNLPLYIGARQGSSGFLQGNIYSLIIRGAASSAAQISSAEAFVNSKTGAW